MHLMKTLYSRLEPTWICALVKLPDLLLNFVDVHCIRFLFMMRAVTCGNST